MDEQTEPTSINIEDIMQEIRQQILAKKDVIKQDRVPMVAISGKRLPPDYYEHIYQASLIHDDLAIKMHVTKTKVPVIGTLLEKLRAKLHELTLFYVNQLAVQQIQFNTHILQAVNLLAQRLEEEEQ